MLLQIDAEEIRLAMADLGVNIGVAEAERLLHKMDRDGSLTIDFDEWRDFLIFAGTSDIRTIFQFWRKSNAIDIGESMTVPDDFTEEEKKSGEALKTMVSRSFVILRASENEDSLYHSSFDPAFDCYLLARLLREIISE